MTLIKPEIEKIDLKLSNMFQEHEVYVRKAGFEKAEEIGIVVIPKDKNEIKSMYFHKDDIPKLIKRLQEAAE